MGLKRARASAQSAHPVDPALVLRYRQRLLQVIDRDELSSLADSNSGRGFTGALQNCWRRMARCSASPSDGPLFGGWSTMPLGLAYSNHCLAIR